LCPALRLDFTGIGETGGDFAGTSPATNVQDLVAAAESLATLFEVPKLLIGKSFAAPADPCQVARTLGLGAKMIAARGEATVKIAGRTFALPKRFLDD
jgi:hypothetical protein